MRPNFTQCGQDFLANAQGKYSQYLYHGKVQGILASDGVRPDLITLHGCEVLCGTGNEYYPWKDASSTITTWVLPILGLLVQAPFETNKFLRTCSALARWVGSPIATLSYTLWNVKVMGKCALMVDMATDCFDKTDQPTQESDFSHLRDSLYILSVMNQYSVFEEWLEKGIDADAEKLLRIALFSDALPLSSHEADPDTLPQARARLARSLRIFRKKGVVPVFVTMFWFLFALAISIQSAFSEIGTNATAHELAIGLLLSWLPVLILVSIVDRNPVATDAVKEQLNDFVNKVRDALLDGASRTTYIQNISCTESDLEWTANLPHVPSIGLKRYFFSQYAGQGRVRWHYGVAHPILAHIEENIVAAKGRGWLEDPSTKSALDRGIYNRSISGLRTFDFREIWQILSALVIVGGTITGAFTLSYFTPTVGLGCRSGGYMIFFVLALTNFALEMLLWPYAVWPLRSFLQKVRNNPRLRNMSDASIRRISRWDSDKWSGGFKHRLLQLLRYWQGLNDRDRFGLLVLTPMDMGNTVWLTYIVLAQTFGSYRNCYCKGSGWGWHKPYIDFATNDFYRDHGVYKYWVPGTALTCFIMTIALAFITVEWCTQSHLNTEDYDDAMNGLRLTRAFKGRTIWLRTVPSRMINGIVTIWNAVFARTNQTKGRRSLVWEACGKRSIKQQNTLSMERGENHHRSQSHVSSVVPLLQRPSETYSRSRSGERRRSSSVAFVDQQTGGSGHELADFRHAIPYNDTHDEVLQ